ncbi:MAG: cell division ATP-binding protein FtsE [Ruminococcaceae bacterium]|nr:cell division ATP-binding protein FtsE [Oscillospiraceae bacterium]
MIEFNDVSKIFPNGTVALENVNLKIEDGEFVFIVGASGAGKSTLMRLLLREEKVSSGVLRVGDYDLTKIPNYKIPYYRRQLGMVFQDFRLFDKKTVYENVAFAMRVIGEPTSVIKRRVPTILSIVGLVDKYKNFPSELSGGEQQRVALARALANNPRIIIADEPTANIDPKMKMEIMNLLAKINSKGKTVIVVTHEKNIVDYFQKRVITIRDGHVVDDRIGGMFEDENV